jgi:hypothetical protein
VFSVSAFAQSDAQIENDLINSLKEIGKYSIDDEKHSTAKDNFRNRLLKYTKIPSTLKYKFPKLGEYMKNRTSEDGKFRIYSWDMEDGGTRHGFAHVYQYLGADGKVHSETDEGAEADDGSAFVQDIFSINDAKGTIYIVCSTFVGSSSFHSQSAELYKIEGNKLNNNVKLFKTRSGLTNSLRFSYDITSLDALNTKDMSAELVRFDKQTKTIKIPVVIENSKYPNGQVTNRFISYHFNGTNFVNVK